MKITPSYELLGITGRARVITVWRVYGRNGRSAVSYHLYENAARRAHKTTRRIEADTAIEIRKADGSFVYILAQFGIPMTPYRDRDGLDIGERIALNVEHGGV